MAAIIENPFHSISINHVKIIELGPWWETAEQVRPFWKLYWNDTDGSAVTLHGKYTILKSGQIYLIAPNTDYKAHFRYKVNHFYIHFTLPLGFTRIKPGIHSVKPPFSLDFIRIIAGKSHWDLKDVLLFQE